LHSPNWAWAFAGPLVANDERLEDVDVLVVLYVSVVVLVELVDEVVVVAWWVAAVVAPCERWPLA
jgi:hypothetical protein